MAEEDFIRDNFKTITDSLGKLYDLNRSTLEKVTRIEACGAAHAADIQSIKTSCAECQERIAALETGFAALKQARDTAVAVVKFAYPKLWTLLKYALAVAGGAGGLEVIKRAIGA